MTKAQQVGRRIAQKRREKAVREQRDIRPAEVAREVGVSGPTYSEWEAGKIIPRDDAMIRLAKFLDTTPEYLRFAAVGGAVAPDPQSAAPILHNGFALDPAHLTDVTEDVDGRDAAIAEGARLVREAAAKKQSRESAKKKASGGRKRR